MLRRIALNIYRRKEIPTVRKLEAYFTVGDDLLNASSATLSRPLRKLGFRYRKRSKNYFTEAPNLFSVVGTCAR